MRKPSFYYPDSRFLDSVPTHPGPIPEFPARKSSNQRKRLRVSEAVQEREVDFDTPDGGSDQATSELTNLN
jgi:hypothetical protein